MLPWLQTCALALGDASPEPESDHTVVSDRPDFANSSLTVPRGGVQIEVGINADVTPDGARPFPLGVPTAVRIGITPRFELRLFDAESAEWVDQDGQIEPREGFGAKLRLLDEDVKRWRPAVALQPLLLLGLHRALLPSGELTLIITQPFGDRVMLDANFGGEYELGAPPDQAWSGFVAGSVGVQVHPSTLLYTEVYVAGTANMQRSLRWGTDGGAVISLTPRFAIDFAARVERFGGRTAVALLSGVTGLVLAPCHRATRFTTKRPMCKPRRVAPTQRVVAK
jgi:hypothetical protein